VLSSTSTSAKKPSTPGWPGSKTSAPCC
jgi:hypothetical protein